VVGLVAQAYLTPDVGKIVDALIAADPDTLTAHDIASDATWADKLRDSNQHGARERTNTEVTDCRTAISPWRPKTPPCNSAKRACAWRSS
jgi:hypothetical protein